MEMRWQSVTNKLPLKRFCFLAPKVQNLSGFQNKVELLKMHIALLLRCSRATLGKGLSCSAPSPADGWFTAELEYTHAYCAAFSHLCCLAPSPAGWRYCRKLSTVCWNGVLGRHFLGIKMEHWNNVWAHFYKILLVFEVPYWPRVKGMPGKS